MVKTIYDPPWPVIVLFSFSFLLFWANFHIFAQIVGLTNPEGMKRYIAAAFPSACGKTNLAMMLPTIPGWKVECVGDDIAWMKFGSDGRLYAINPENGFFGVAPGTSMSSNPNAMRTIFKNTIFTNTGLTSDGGVYWEGMEPPEPGISITSWKGTENWQNLSQEERVKLGEQTASHANARFCTPISQYPYLDPNWESSEGVPIDAILFGGRRPTTIPLVYESFNWKHGVFVGAAMKSETTAAASDTKKGVQHDPFAMRPFFGYNFAHYLNHWLSLESKPGVKLPKIFHVNWFRKDDQGKFVWPGFGENLRVMDWILRRCSGEDCAVETPLGYVPKANSINMEGLAAGSVKKDWLFRLDKRELLNDLSETESYFREQIPDQLPATLQEEVTAMKERINRM